MVDQIVRVLHLEDNAADAELVHATLESVGISCEITPVQTREEYSDSLRKGGYDIILADYRLPGYEGMSALRLTQELCPHIPFIFVSGTMGEDAAIEALTEGATDYVLKQKLSRLAPAIKRALYEAENQRERKRAEERLAKLNERFLMFGADPLANINLLVALCGELMGATCALYNRLQGDMLCSLGQWNTPEGYRSTDLPEGHICYDVINSTNDSIVFISNLQDSPYARTDPNVRLYQLKTYIGKAVKFGGENVGSLCIVFQHDVIPSDNDMHLMDLIASAIGVEEDRKRAEEALRESEAKYRALTEKINDVVWTMNIDRTLTYISPSVEKALGYTPEELIGHNAGEILTSESLAHAMEIQGKELDRDGQEGVDPYRSVLYEIAYNHKNGSIVWFENVASAIRDDLGRIMGSKVYPATSPSASERRRRRRSLSPKAGNSRRPKA